MSPDDVPEGPVALDTDVFSFLHLRKGPYARFAPLVAGHRLSLPFSVIGELKVMPIQTRGSAWGPRNTERLNEALERCVPLPATGAVVDQWANLYARFKGRLKEGGVNDMWAAATCLVFDVPLVTGNLSDFQTIATEFPLRLVHPDL